ncbi:MAG: dihydrofolate reductase family protein [Caldilineaceae bacterium]
MRKLKLQVQMTVDGFVGGPHGEMDWISFNWDEELVKYVTALTESFDTIVLGRNLAEGFIPHWAGVAADPNHPEHAAGKIFSAAPKIVFSHTLEASKWDNTVLATGDLVDEITKLKQQEGKDIIVYGGATFVADLIKHGLIDEYHLFVNPTAIGQGKAIFSELESYQRLVLKHVVPFKAGIVVLCYEPNQNA